MKLKGTVCIEAPVEKVWEVLADVANVQDWVGVINRSYCEGEQTQGIGTVRVCHLTTGTTIKEEWIAWEEGQWVRDAAMAYAEKKQERKEKRVV